MSAKNQTNWSPEQLEKWAKPALDHPELIDIARTATGNTEAKNRALEFTTERGLDEKVAMACRWLRILREKYPERFEKLVSQIEQKPKEGRIMKKKNLEEMEFKLPRGTELITREFADTPSPYFQREFSIKFRGSKRFDTLLLEMLEAFNSSEDAVQLAQVAHVPELYEEIEKKMIQIIEEKFGLTVRVCGNCKFNYLNEFCRFGIEPNSDGSWSAKDLTKERFIKDRLYCFCKHWEPKEKEVPFHKRGRGSTARPPTPL